MLDLTLTRSEVLRSVTPHLPAELVQAARNWLSECVWADAEPEDFEAMPIDRVIRGIKRHYDGGLQAFIRDGQA